MRIKISKNLPYQILFGLCIGVTYLNIYELNFAVWVFTIAITFKKSYSIDLLKYTSFFVAIFIIAFIATFFYDNSFYESIRDVTYLIKPILGLLVGYQLCRNYDIKPFETIIYTGVAIAIIHLSILMHSVVIYRIVNIHALRMRGGYFSDFEVFSLILIMFYKQLGLVFSTRQFWIIIAILALSSFMYLSRTNFIQFVIFYLAMKGFLSLNKKSIVIFSLFTAFLLIGYSVIYNMNLSRNGKGMEALLFKIKNAPIEPFKTKVDPNDWADFNDNYRSYETIRTVKQVANTGTQAIIFGKGLGATVNMGREVRTNEGTFVRKQAILHNANSTVFLKAGLVGVFFLILSVVYLCRQKKSNIPIVQQINVLLFSTGIFLIVANWVLLGLYLKLDNKSILIGFLMCYRELIIKRSNQELKLNKVNHAT
ncbi:hypothetical protein [Flavobacterium tegetincola]|uniref:hypothetical protein n=1 Tax=Flavobacterium tegetincola TaxID=150172 RepID=UPI000416BA11|nr:hypothetical protein [Flavobacterium tegetincola]